MMIRKKFVLTVFVIVFLLAAAFGTFADPAVKQVSRDGFGNRNNRYAWSMEEFNNHLYVGTLNSTIGFPGDCEACDEIDLLMLPDKQPWGVGLSEGSEIWRYNGYSWEQVMDEGWGDIRNAGVRSMLVHEGSLYAGATNVLSGCEVWKTSNGTAWEQVGLNGLGRIGNTSVRGMASWNGRLYVGTVNFAGGQIWSTDGDDWLVSALFGISDFTNLAIGSLQVHNGYLFAGTWNALHGCQVYRFDGSEWVQVVGPESSTQGGFGEIANAGILSMADFHGALYVGTVNFVRGFTLWRTTDDGETWEKIGENGFGDSRLKYVWDMEIFGDELFFGSLIIGRQMLFHHGAYLFKSADGETWDVAAGKGEMAAPPGFGDRNNYGFRTLEPFHGRLYVGTAQCFFCIRPVTGAEVWRLTP